MEADIQRKQYNIHAKGMKVGVLYVLVLTDAGVKAKDDGTLTTDNEGRLVRFDPQSGAVRCLIGNDWLYDACSAKDQWYSPREVKGLTAIIE